MTVAARPKVRAPGTYELRLNAVKDPKVYEDWLAFQRKAMKFVEPGFRERLMERHRQVGPMSQYHDLKTIDAFDVQDRIATLKPKLLLLRGLEDPERPAEVREGDAPDAAGVAATWSFPAQATSHPWSCRTRSTR